MSQALSSDFGHGPIYRGTIATLAAALPVGVVLWAGDLFRLIGILLYPEQFGAGMLGVALALVYLSVPASGGKVRIGPLPWYDLALGMLGLMTCVMVAIYFPRFSIATFRSPLGLGLSAVLIPLVLEGARRTAGVPIIVVGLIFLVLGVSAWLLPGELTGRRVGADSLVWYLTWNTSAILGQPTMIAVTIGVAFVLFGQALFLSGGSQFFTDISMALMGRFRGGQAKIAVVASALFGTISGSAVVNIISTGVVTIPMMKRAGYRPHVAGAIETVASTGGQLMPPVMGVAAFLIAEFLQIPYAEIALAALIPSVIYFAALFIQVDLEAARYGITRVAQAEIPRIKTVMRQGWIIPVPFIVLVAAMFWLNLPLDLAALYAALAVTIVGVVLGYRGEKLGPRQLIAILTSTGNVVLDLIMIVPIAGIVIGVLNVTGLSFTLALSLVAAAGGNPLILLFLTAGVSIVLGMGMPTVGVYILLATLVAPALIQVGFDPLAAHLFIFYFGMLSMITPPIAMGAFAAAAIAKASPMLTGFASVRFGWAAFVVPFLFIFSPSLLFKSGPLITGVDVATALSAVWLIAAGFTGFSVRHIMVATRIAYIIAGACLIVPIRMFEGAVYLIAAGAVLGLALLVFDLMKRPSQAHGAPASDQADIHPVTKG